MRVVRTLDFGLQSLDRLWAQFGPKRFNLEQKPWWPSVRVFENLYVHVQTVWFWFKLNIVNYSAPFLLDILPENKTWPHPNVCTDANRVTSGQMLTRPTVRGLGFASFLGYACGEGKLKPPTFRRSKQTRSVANLVFRKIVETWHWQARGVAW